MMRKLLAIGALLLASSAAQAQYTFEYGGHTIRIDPDRGTVQIPGVYDNTSRKTRRAKSEAKTEESKRGKQAPQQAKTDTVTAPDAAATAPAPADPATAPAATAIPPAPPPPAPALATSDPATTTAPSVAPPAAPAAATAPPSPPAPPAPPSPQEAAVTAKPAPAPPAAPVPKPVPVAQTPSPLGIWWTEEKEGQVRIEQCGANLCGYAVDKKSSQNGEQVLINMKPDKDRWSGRILDPKTGSTYDSTIALRGADTLRVEGCAFGGMFCGGQTWTRVN
jgi:uncharacterized protein (DUF2147 family)